jgi:hypothetical protein
VIDETVTKDVKVVGKAAKNEVKHGAIDEVLKGGRSVFKGIFD